MRRRPDTLLPIEEAILAVLAPRGACDAGPVHEFELARGIAGRVAGGLGWTVAALGYVLLVGTSASAAATLLLSADARSDPLWVRWTALPTAILLTQIAGALISARRPRTGFVVLTAGVWSVAAAMWCAWPIAVPAAIAASIGLYRLARRRTKTRPLVV